MIWKLLEVLFNLTEGNMVIILMVIQSEMVVKNSSDLQRKFQIGKKSTTADNSTPNKIPVHNKERASHETNESIATTIVNAASTAANAAIAAANAATAAANAAIAASNAAIAAANTLNEAVKGLRELDKTLPLIEKEGNDISIEENLTEQIPVFKTNKAKDTDMSQEEPMCLCACVCQSKKTKAKQTESESSSLPGFTSAETSFTSLSSTGTEDMTENEIMPTNKCNRVFSNDNILLTTGNMSKDSIKTISPSYKFENLKSDMGDIENNENVTMEMKPKIMKDTEGQETYTVFGIGSHADVAMAIKPNTIINKIPVNKEGIDTKDSIIVSPTGTLLLTEIKTEPTDLSRVKQDIQSSTSTNKGPRGNVLKEPSDELFQVRFSDPLPISNEKSDMTIIQKGTDVLNKPDHERKETEVERDSNRLKQTVKTANYGTQTCNEIVLLTNEARDTEVTLTPSNSIGTVCNQTESPTLNVYYVSSTNEINTVTNAQTKRMDCNTVNQFKNADNPFTSINNAAQSIEKYIGTRNSPLMTDEYANSMSIFENNAISTNIKTKKINSDTLSGRLSTQVRQDVVEIQENQVYKNQTTKARKLTPTTHSGSAQVTLGKIDNGTNTEVSQFCLDNNEYLQEGCMMKYEKSLICNNGKFWESEASVVTPDCSSSLLSTQDSSYDVMMGIDMPVSYENEEKVLTKKENLARHSNSSNKVIPSKTGKFRVMTLPKQKSKIPKTACNSFENMGMPINLTSRGWGDITGKSAITSDTFNSKHFTGKNKNSPYTIVMEGNTLEVYEDDIIKDNSRIIIGKDSLESAGSEIMNAKLLTSEGTSAGKENALLCSGKHSQNIPLLFENGTNIKNAPLVSRSTSGIRNVSSNEIKPISSNQCTLQNISFQNEPTFTNIIGKSYNTAETNDNLQQYSSMPTRGKLSAQINQNKFKTTTLPIEKTKKLYETVLSSDNIEAFAIDMVGGRTGGASRIFRHMLEDCLLMPISQHRMNLNLERKSSLPAEYTNQQEEKNGSLGCVVGTTMNSHKKNTKSGVTFQATSTKPKNLSERIALQAKLYESDSSGSMYLRRLKPCTVPTKRDASTTTSEEEVSLLSFTLQNRNTPGQWYNSYTKT